MSTALETGMSTFPYPGLRPYEKQEADLFFGREEHVDQLLAKLERHRFLAVIGPSGCGKSSLVRAGLVAAVESGFLARAGLNWRAAVMRPGGQPLANLASALLAPDGFDRRMDCHAEELAFLGATLRRGPLGLVEAFRDAVLPERTNLLVLVDQFEEIFRYHRLGGTSEANAFVDLLLTSAAEPSAPIYVVLTMRSDHLGNCTIFRDLPEAMNDSQFLTPRLTREQNRAAIVGPAKMFGVEIQPEVVTRILNEMGTDPDQLPLMQHLLMRMWRRVTHGQVASNFGGQLTMTVEDYEAVGGLANALSDHVERIYQRLPDDASKRIAETAFRNLTEISPDGQVVRRPVKLSEICTLADASPDQIVPVLDEFRAEGRSFLVPPYSERLNPETVIDISHESLIRQWRQLGDWTKDEEKAHQTARVVMRETRKWHESGRDNRALLTELRLLEAEAWAKTHPRHVDPEEREFLKASRDHLDREARRWRVVSRILAALVLFLLSLAAVNFYEIRRVVVADVKAKNERDRAQKAEVVATIERDRAQKAEVDATKERDRAQTEATRSHDLLRQKLETRARALAAESQRILRQDFAGALTLAVQAKRMTEEKNFPTPEEVERSLLSAVGSQQIVPPLSPVFPASVQKITTVAFSPDGQWLVTGGFGSTAQLWRFEAGAHRLTSVALEGHTESVDMVAVSSGDPHVATLDHDGVVRLWGPKQGDRDPQQVLLKGAAKKLYVIALSGEGRWLAAGGPDGEALLWPLKNADRSASAVRLSGHTQEILCVAFDSKGNWLATADRTGLVQLWNLAASPASPKSLGWVAHSNGVYGLAFSPDSRQLAATDYGGSTRLWNLREGDPADPVVLRSEGSLPVAVAFSADGRRLATSENGGMIHFWEASDSEGAAPFQAVNTLTSSVFKLAFSSGAGRWLGAMDFSGRVWLWDVSGAYPAVISLKDATAEWRRATSSRQTALTVPRLPAQVSGFAFHPDGRSLVTINAKGGVLLWDLSNLDTTTSFDPFKPNAGGSDWPRMLLRQSPGDATEHSTGESLEGSSRLWTSDHADTSASVVLLVKKPPNSTAERTSYLASGALGPDGRTVALPGPDGSIKLWDATAPPGSATKMLPGRPGHRIYALAFSPAVPGGRRWLASGAKMRLARQNAGTVSLWDLDVSDPAAPAAELGDHEGEILSLAFSPDGRWLITGAGGPARLWDLKNGLPSKPTVVLGKPGVPTRAVAFGPTATDWVAVGSGDGQILLWKLSSDPIKDSPRSLSPHSGSITRLVFSADGRRLISTSEDGTARRWSLDAHDPGGRFVEFARHLGGITCLAISDDADRRWLATGGGSGEVRICRLDGEVFESYPVAMDGYRGTIVDLAFSGDGRLLAISCEDKSVRVVTVNETGHVLDSPILLGDEHEMSTLVGLSRNGRVLIAAGPHGTARVWPLRWMPGLDQLAAQLAERNLSHDEWERHFPKEDYRKTFDLLPVHESLFDAARGLAKQGQREEALRRLRQLTAIDHGTGIDPKGEVDRSVAEVMIDNGRNLAKAGEKDQAIDQFLAACKLVLNIVADPQREANKYEVMGLIAEVDGLIENMQIAVNKPDTQVQVQTTQAGDGVDLLADPLHEAQVRYDKAVTLNQQGRCDLNVEIGRTGRRLMAVTHDRKARQLAAEGTIPKAVAEFKEAAKLAPEYFKYAPEAAARQVASARAKRAHENGRRLVSEKKTSEAVKEFELAATLDPEDYPISPETLVQELITSEAAAADANGRQLAADGKLQEAIIALSKAHDLDKGSYDYDPRDEVNQAVRDQKLLQADKRLEELVSHTRAGRYDQATAMFKRAQSLDPDLVFDPEDYVNRVRAELLVEDGTKLIADQGKQNTSTLELKESLQKFGEAKGLDPRLELDPDQLADRLAGRVWVERARSLAAHDSRGAKAALEKARSLLGGLKPQEPKHLVTLDPETQQRHHAALAAVRLNLGLPVESAGVTFCKNGLPNDALALYEHAVALDPLLSVSSDFWNRLCWTGSLQGADGAKRFGFAADLALALEPANGNYRDTRGLARALQGDREGAIRDFEAFLWFATNHLYRKERRQWISLLRSPKPVEQIFSPEVLKRLKKE